MKWPKFPLEQERPEKIREYKKGTFKGVIKNYFLGILEGELIFLLSYQFYKWAQPFMERKGYLEDALKGNALLYFAYFFTWLLPVIIVGTFHSKKLTPSYSFSMLIGILTISAINILQNKTVASYMLFCVALLLFINLPSHSSYLVHLWHLFYYFLLGAIVNYYTTLIMAETLDIWTYLQFIYLHLLTSILIAVKLRPWSYAYLGGWFTMSIIVMIVMPKEPYFLLGLYNLIAPTILVWAVFVYFYKIYLPIADRFRKH